MAGHCNEVRIGKAPADCLRLCHGTVGRLRVAGHQPVYTFRHEQVTPLNTVDTALHKQGARPGEPAASLGMLANEQEAVTKPEGKTDGAGQVIAT